jgi:hypothetical protein
LKDHSRGNWHCHRQNYLCRRTLGKIFHMYFT